MNLSLSIQALADVSSADSLSNRLRARRFRVFESLVSSLPRPVTILDIGGTNSFWEQRGWAGRSDVRITLLNRFPQADRHPNIQSWVGDATRLNQFGNGSFDIAFSNSVIEHLFTFDNQKRMASEIRRVGRSFWVQTPNFWFPMEPHFHIPGWQWMPSSLRIALLRRRRCGWLGPYSDTGKARDAVMEVRLMTAGELRSLFPGAHLIPERFAGLVKSWIAIDGFTHSNSLANHI